MTRLQITKYKLSVDNVNLWLEIGRSYLSIRETLKLHLEPKRVLRIRNLRKDPYTRRTANVISATL